MGSCQAVPFEQLKLAIEGRFGPSTEKYRVEQGDLLINEAEVAVDEEEASAQDDTVDGEVDAPAAPTSRSSAVPWRPRGVTPNCPASK